MLLSDKTIRDLVSQGFVGYPKGIGITGIDNPYIGPSSVDLHLDNKAKILDIKKVGKDTKPINISDPKLVDLFTEHNDWKEITIHPGEFYLLHSKEILTFPDDIAGFIQGRSSIARLGINIHAAGFFDPGFHGSATLEVTNFTSVPITIPAGTRIAQMLFVQVDQPVGVNYRDKKDSKYFGQSEPTITKSFQDYEQK